MITERVQPIYQGKPIPTYIFRISVGAYMLGVGFNIANLRVRWRIPWQSCVLLGLEFTVHTVSCFPRAPLELLS